MARPPVPLFGSKPAVPKFQAPPRIHLADENDEDLHQSLKIVGQSASFCEDDKTAAWLESQQHLQQWMGDKEEDLWVDRYDVRLLLSDVSLFARRGQASTAAVDDPEDKMLDAERYIDLPPEGEEAAPPHEYEGEAEEVDGPDRAISSSRFGAVHFSFGGQGSSQPAQQQNIPPEIVAFATGWLTELAPGSALPQTFKQHQVIERTAKFVHKQGKKMEAMLKVKHGGNAAFQFLLVDHPLQAYYQALLKYLGYCPEAADLPTLLPSVELPAEVASEAAEATAEKAPAGGAHTAEQDSAAMPEASADASAAAVASSAVASASAEQADQMLAKAIADAKQKLEKEKERAAGAEEGAPASAGNDEPARSSEGKRQEATQAVSTLSIQEGDGIHQQIPVPPDEMLQTIEKLVRWILKSGRDFEKKVKERQRGDPRFEFLMPWNPYNAFYRQRLDDAFNGKLDEHVGDTASAASGAAVPPWRVIAHPTLTPASAESAETGEGNEPASTDEAGADLQSAAQEIAAQNVKPTDEENPKVQFITSFGDDSEEEKTEEKPESTANTTVEQASATSEQGTETAEAAPRKERNSRFGPDLSETEKKAARLARAKQLSLLVKDKVEAVKTAETADSKAKDKEQKSSKESKRSRKSRSRSRSPKSRTSSRRSSSRSRSRSRSSRRRRSRSRDRHGRKHSKRDTSNSRERKRRRSSRSRSKDRSRSHSRDRNRDRSRSDRGKLRHKDRDRSPKQKSRRRSRSPHHRRRRSSSKSRSRSRSRSHASKTTSLKQPTAGTSSSPPRPDAREDVAATDADVGTEGSTVSAELRDKVKAMLGQLVP